MTTRAQSAGRRQQTEPQQRAATATGPLHRATCSRKASLIDGFISVIYGLAPDQRSHTFQVNKQFPFGWFPLFASPRHYCCESLSPAVQTLFVFFILCCENTDTKFTARIKHINNVFVTVKTQNFTVYFEGKRQRILCCTFCCIQGSMERTKLLFNARYYADITRLVYHH